MFSNHYSKIGKIALKLLERKGSSQYKSRVFSVVYDRILWASEPLQSVGDSHLQGYKAGQLSGDIIYGLNNLLLAITTDYVAGQNLEVVRKNIHDYLLQLKRHGIKLFLKLAILLHSQIMVLKEGLDVSTDVHFDGMPSEGEILADSSSNLKVFAAGKVHHLTRAFLFRQMDDASLQNNISKVVAESHHQLTSTYLMGYFFEGLASFLLARQSINNVHESAKWIERGLSVLTRMRCWSEYSSWNWEDKLLLLEAENMHTMVEFEKASSLYDSAIRSAHEHKFVHGEAIASELAGAFYHKLGLHQKSYSYYVHSAKCYEKWGAHAVARRVDSFMRDNFPSDIGQRLVPSSSSCTDTSLEYLFASCQPTGSKKRHDGD